MLDLACCLEIYISADNGAPALFNKSFQYHIPLISVQALLPSVEYMILQVQLL